MKSDQILLLVWAKSKHPQYPTMVANLILLLLNVVRTPEKYIDIIMHIVHKVSTDGPENGNQYRHRIANHITAQDSNYYQVQY